MLRFIKPVLIILSFFLLAFLVLRFIPYPGLENYRSRSYGFQVLDRNGQVLRVFPSQDGVKRDWVSLKDIPPGAVRVFLRAEDRRFYFHPGIDPIAIGSAALRNISAGRTVSGASTITMQLVRLVNPGRQGFRGKLSEAFDALRIEARLSKKQILELWINGIPFGSNIEGISAITRARFGKNISELDDTRAALLAVIPRRPALYDPALNPEAAVRAALTLAVAGVDRAALENAAIEAGQYNNVKNPFFAPHFTERAAAFVNTEVSRVKPPPLRTTLDLELQSYAEKRLSEELALLENNRVSNGAVFVINNADGSVLVYAGSRSWFDDSISGKIDGVLTENQPGSCLKPFLYALALEKGFNPNDILPDIPTIFGSSEAYSPANFNNRFNGPVRFRIALASSLNIPAVYLLERLGVRSFEEYLVSLGFNSIYRTMGTHGAGLALGNAAVSLEELVRGFSVFPNQGILKDIRFIQEQDVSEEQIISSGSAWIITDILSDRESRFIGFGPAPVMATEFTSIFKTGTANQFQHIWALGATARFTVGVWMGNFSGETVVGRTGSSIPARIASDLLRALEYTFPADNILHDPMFQRPVDLTLVKICALSGMSAGAACAGTAHEWIFPESIPRQCTWHQNEIVYPAEYQAWLRERFRSGSTAPARGSAYIRIPVNGSVFYFDPALPPEAQAIRIETAGFGIDALVYNNEILQGVVNQAGVFALPLYRGRHRIAVEDDNGSAAFVEIEVR
jgi:penicillin-binding protein 1C